MNEIQRAVQQGLEEPLTIPPWSRNPWTPPSNLRQITQQCIDVFLASRKPNGSIDGIGWWQQANAYTAIALHDAYANSSHNHSALAHLARQRSHHKANFINEFNDDSLWWGLLCLHLRHAGKDEWFLNRTKAVWNHLLQSHSVIQHGQFAFKGVDMAGGCFWTTKPDEEQVNAITTGLFAELSARLALHEQAARSHLGAHLARTCPASTAYVQHARRALAWILRCRYQTDGALVLDNILVRRQQARDWVWSYNTGVAIGVCALLHEATAGGEQQQQQQQHATEYLTLACTMARKAMLRARWVEPNGVLDEPAAYGRGRHDPAKNNDAVGFKAVLLRHLGTLYGVVRRTAARDVAACATADLIKTFVNVNLQSQLERNTDGAGRYGPWWNGPFEVPTSHSQMAVLDVMAAAVLVNTI